MKTLDNGLSRAEFEYLYDTDNEEPETNQSEFEDSEEFRRILWSFCRCRTMLHMVMDAFR